MVMHNIDFFFHNMAMTDSNLIVMADADKITDDFTFLYFKGHF